LTFSTWPISDATKSALFVCDIRNLTSATEVVKTRVCCYRTRIHTHCLSMILSHILSATSPLSHCPPLMAALAGKGQQRGCRSAEVRQKERESARGKQGSLQMETSNKNNSRPEDKRMHPPRASASSAHANLPLAPLSLSRLPSLSSSALPHSPRGLALSSLLVLSIPALRHLPPSRSYLISRVDLRLCRKQHLRNRTVAAGSDSNMKRRPTILPGTRAAGRGEQEARAHARQRRLHTGRAREEWGRGRCCGGSQRW